MDFRATTGRHYTPGAAFVERSGLAQFAANGVRVEVSSESDSQGLPLLRATFTPSDLGFHLYSKDLNTNSTGGIGVATRLELLPNPSVRVDGRLFADARPHLANTLDRNMETYPDGPVSLHLPIQVIGESTNIAARVAVSYMACAEGVCLRPIESQLLDVQIPSN